MRTSIRDLPSGPGRERLAASLLRIHERLHPMTFVKDAIAQARRDAAAGAVYEQALDAVHRNPLPVIMIFAGVSLLAR